MANPTLIGWLRRLPPPDHTPDGELARRYLATGDQAAFELLVRRHITLVYRICSSVVHDQHLAEDAAQAVFLILARKAGSVTGLRSVAGWLARVSYRTANRARRRVDPLGLPSHLADDRTPADDAETGERSAIIAAEVTRLPPRYREPVALCYFEGLTNAAAAARLGCPPGTVAGRLARARRLLATRLARRGVTLPATFAVMVPAGFVDHVLAAAPSAVASRLATEVLSTMTPLSRRMIVACGVSLLAVVAGLSARPDDPPKPAPPPAEFVVEGQVIDDTTRKPMPGVTVRIVSQTKENDLPASKTVTDAGGRYRLVFGPSERRQDHGFEGVEAEIYATKPGWYGWASSDVEHYLGHDRTRKPGSNSFYGSWTTGFVLRTNPPTPSQAPKPGYAVLRPGQPAQLPFRMAPAATLRVKLTDAAGKPMAGERLRLEGDRAVGGPRFVADAKTDADGRWSATELPLYPMRLVLCDRHHYLHGWGLGQVDTTEAAEYTADVVVRACSDAGVDVSYKLVKGRKLSP